MSRTPPATSGEQLARRVRVARAEEAGDLLLRGGRVVNVFTGQTAVGDVVIADGQIVGVGAGSWKAREEVDLSGQFVMPGLIDSHMHLESTLLLPAHLASLIVPRGTTATISDSHEIGNVLGLEGIDQMLAASEGVPFDLFLTASSCVPATRDEDSGSVLGPAEVERLLDRPRVLALAEMMDIPAVLRGDPEALAKLRAALTRGMPLDGHAPRLLGLDLQAYAAVGIRSDHESETAEEARQKAALGMLVQVRDGSIAHNLEALLPLLVSGELGDRWTLVTDDIMPDDLRREGHLDSHLRRVVAAGVPGPVAVRQASLVPARHYGLSDRGAVAPSYRADLVVTDDLREFRVARVYKDGREVARDGELLWSAPPTTSGVTNTVHLPQLEEQHFRLPLSSAECPVIGIVPGQLVTRALTMTVGRDDGMWAFDPARDVIAVASIERHRATGKMGLGLVSGFGFRRHAAIASTVAHDSHNLIVAGTNPRDMLVCARALAECAGGFVIAWGGEVKGLLPLPVAGLLSDRDGDTVCHALELLRACSRAVGCPLDNPFGPLSFLALPVIPELRVTTRGLWDVARQEQVPL